MAAIPLLFPLAGCKSITENQETVIRDGADRVIAAVGEIMQAAALYACAM